MSYDDYHIQLGIVFPYVVIVDRQRHSYLVAVLAGLESFALMCQEGSRDMYLWLSKKAYEHIRDILTTSEVNSLREYTKWQQDQAKPTLEERVQDLRRYLESDKFFTDSIFGNAVDDTNCDQWGIIPDEE